MHDPSPSPSNDSCRAAQSRQGSPLLHAGARRRNRSEPLRSAAMESRSLSPSGSELLSPLPRFGLRVLFFLRISRKCHSHDMQHGAWGQHGHAGWAPHGQPVGSQPCSQPSMHGCRGPQRVRVPQLQGLAVTPYLFLQAQQAEVFIFKAPRGSLPAVRHKLGLAHGARPGAVQLPSSTPCCTRFGCRAPALPAAAGLSLLIPVPNAGL